jgi:hypothetical protein
VRVFGYQGADILLLLGIYKSMSRPKKEKKLQVMMSEKEYQALAEYAAKMQLTMSEVVRDFIRKLDTYP